MFEQLFNSTLLYSLSLTLMHFVWQGLLVALILKLALFLIDDNESKTRYNLATIAMLANAVLAIYTFSSIHSETNTLFNNITTPSVLSVINGIPQQGVIGTQQVIEANFLTSLLPYFSLLWLITITVLACKLLIQIRSVNRLPMSSVPASAELSLRFEQLAQQIELPRTPTLLISLKAQVPMAIGWLKPVVLLPTSMVSGLNTAQLEMLILHELAHIRRHDYLVNFLQSLIELIFFFHPCVHWIGKQMRHEREYCSDDIAVQHCGDAIAYAHTLTDTASLCSKGHNHTIPTMAMAASGGDLKTRVIRLVDHHCAPSNYTSKSLAAISLLLALILLSISHVVTVSFTQQLTSQPASQTSLISKQNTPLTPNNHLLINDNYQFEITPNLTTTAIPPQLLLVDNIPNNVVLFDNEKDANKSVVLQRQETDTLNIKTLAESEIQLTYSETNKTHLIKPNQELNQTGLVLDTSLVTKNDAIINNHTTTEITPIAVSEDIINTSTVSQDESAKTPTMSAKMTTDVVTHSKAKTLEQESLAALTTVTNQVMGEEKEKTITLDTLSSKIEKPVQTTKQLPIKQIKQLAIIKTPNIIQSPQQDINQETALSLLSSNKLLASNLKNDILNESLNEEMVTPELLNESHKAELLSSITPKYPNRAKFRKIEMEVQVNFTIDEQGNVKDINFNEQNKLSYFKSAVRSAVSQWRFSPATQNNHTVESKMSKIFSFSLSHT